MADRAELRQHERFLPARRFQRTAYARRARVRVDAQDVEVGIVRDCSFDLGRLRTGDHRHHGVIGVFLFHDAGEHVEFLPDAVVVALVHGAFHLVAQTPQQEGGLVLVPAHGRAHVVALLLHHRFVGVVEPVPFVLDPEAGGHGETQFRRPLDERFGVHGCAQGVDVPGAERIAAELHKFVEVMRPANAVDVVWLAVAF